MSTNGIDFFGKKNGIELSTLKGGLKKTDLKGDANLESIFDKIDVDKNGILSDSEVNNLFNSLDNKSYTNSEGKKVGGNNDGFLDKKEAEFFLKDNFGKDQIKDLTSSFGTLLNMIKGKSDNVESVTTSDQGFTTVMNRGDAEDSGKISELYDDNGNILTKSYNTEDNACVNEAYQEDGKIKTKTISSPDGSYTTISYNDGVPDEVKIVKGTVSTTYACDADGNPTDIKEKIENEGHDTLETRTTYEYNDTESGREITRTVSKSGGRTEVIKEINGQLISSIVPCSGDNTVERFYKDGDVNCYTQVETDTNGNVVHKAIIDNGERTGGVAYDSNGNTWAAYNSVTGDIQNFKVQVGEQSIATLANKYGVSVEDMYEANKDNPYLIGTGANAKFSSVGCSFVLPGKLEPDDARIQGNRQTSLQIRIDATNHNEQALKAISDGLMAKYKREGLLNTNGMGEHIFTSSYIRYGEEFKSESPVEVEILGEGFGGCKIGQVYNNSKNPRIVYIDKEGRLIEDNMVKNGIRDYAYSPSKASTITVNGKEIDVMDYPFVRGYNAVIDLAGNVYISENGNYVTYDSQKAEQRELAKAQGRINNTVDALSKSMSGASLNSSINSEDFKSAFAQITADNVIDIIHTYEFRKGEPFVECIMEETSSSISSRRETCKSLVNKLNDKAIAVGMPEAQRQALYQACINACNSADAWNTETLVSKVNEFYGSVVAAEMNHGSKADVSFGDVAQDNIMGARAGIEEQTYKQSVLGTAWEYSLSPDHTLNLIDTITNNSFLPDTAFGTGRSAAYHKIDKFESTIKNLEDIRRTKGEDAFKAAFKKEFGVEYSQDALNNYVNLKHKFDTAVTQKNTINLMQHLADTVTPDNVDEIIENFISAFPEKDRSKYRAALNSTIQANMNKGYSKATAFEQCLNTYIQDARRVYNEATEGQDLSLLGNSLNGAFDGMFGAKAGINSEVREYVVRQQKGEQYTATSGKIAIAVVASVVTQNPAIGAIIVTAGGMAQDTLQMGTSHYHGDGAFGTDLSGARASAAAGENLINGVGTYVGGNFGNITQELGTAARLGSDIVLDSAMSVGGDVMNGNEVTLESIGGSVLSASFGNFVGHNTRNEIFGAIAKEGASSVVDGALNVNSIPTNTEYSSQNLGESLASSMGVSKSLGDNIANNEIEDNNKPKGA